MNIPKKTNIKSTINDAGQLIITPIPAVATKAILAARVTALTITQEILDLAKDLAVETESQYHSADDILHKIKVAQKRLDQPFEDVIRPVRQGLDGVYAIRREVENPLLDLEKTVKEKMRAFKLAEAERIRKEEAERARLLRIEQSRVAEEQLAEQARRIVEAAKANDFQKALEILEEEKPEVAVIFAAPVQAPVRAASSSSRTIKRWRVTDLDLVIEATRLDMAPTNILQINATKVQEMFKLNPASIDEIPGMETYDDIQIAGR